MMKPLHTILVACVLLAAPLLAAQPRVVELDPDATTIDFTLGATLHTVEGTLRLDRGEVRYDPGTGAASGEVVIDATSADTDSRKRDRKMHEKVLESDRYPEIVLEVQSVDGELPAAGDTGSMTLHGTIELHGDHHPVSIPLEVARTGDRLELVFDLRVPYVEWGLEDPSAFVLRVEKHVDVHVEATGVLSRDDGTGAAEPDQG
jgi:polyisoprenoid-binding protein YceI